MKTQQQCSKLKTPPRPLFSCGIFSYCNNTHQNVLSPTSPQPNATSFPPPLSQQSHLQTLPPSSGTHPLQPVKTRPDSESSSSSTSQSFTQWRFPLPKSPGLHYNNNPQPDPNQESTSDPNPKPEPIHVPMPIPTPAELAEIFHLAETQLGSDSTPARLAGIHLLERSLVPNPPLPMCPPLVMDRVVGLLKDPVGAKPATKVLLALCLVEGNRCAAVGARAVGEVVELLAGAGLEGGAVERALAVLELLCTVAEGAEEVRGHALAVPVMVEVMGRMSGRAKEYAISVLCVILGGGENTVEPPPEVVVRAVVMALQGDCSARGRRKGAQLLKVLKENGPLDFTEDGRQGTSSIKFDDD